MALRGKNRRVSTIYKLGRSQATLDFVDVDVRTDTGVFISPRALAIDTSDWGDGCVSLVQSFFETVLAKIKGGDNAGAEALLTQLREPNETHLGLSAGRSQGRALGTESAHYVWGALSNSEAAKSGLLRDLEDTVLLIPGIGVDIVSDITTNIIRAPLIEYTQEQCRQLGIPMTQGVASGPLWHPTQRTWINKFVEMPITKEGKLLFVPKAIVRRSPLYDIQEYYRHYMLEHMIQEELKAGSSFVHLLKNGSRRVYKSDLIDVFGQDKNAVIKQTFKYPDVLDRYREEKDKVPFLPLSHEELAIVENDDSPDWDALLSAVLAIPAGKADADAYEKAIEALLTALFYPELSSPSYQHKIHSDRKRIDIRYTNMAAAGFFWWLAQNYSAPHIYVECKNYASDPANPELDQLSGRFSPSRGKVGLLICRTFNNKARFLERCRDTANDHRGFIIALDDDDLSTLVAARKADSQAYRQWPLLKRRFDDLID